jgi:hypothetical protein
MLSVGSTQLTPDECNEKTKTDSMPPCWQLKDCEVPTLVTSRGSLKTRAALPAPYPVDVELTIFCGSYELNKRETRPFGRSGEPYMAVWASEPSYRSASTDPKRCAWSASVEHASRLVNFWMSFWPGADIFLPPWELHIPIPLEALFFADTPGAGVYRLRTWSEKAAMLDESFFDHSSEELQKRVQQLPEPEVMHPGRCSSKRPKGLALGAFIADNCEDILRKRVVQELQSLGPKWVDSSAHCLHSASLPCDALAIDASALDTLPVVGDHRRAPRSPANDRFVVKYLQKQAQMSHYMFFYSFENEPTDPMWLTEKFIGPFVAGTVPVILGPSAWSRRFLPAPHSAIFLSDFQSVTAMAKYLHYVACNETAYEEYLAYQQNPRHTLNPRFLALFASRRQQSLCMLAKFAVLADKDPSLAHNHRVFVGQTGLVPVGTVHNQTIHVESDFYSL